MVLIEVEISVDREGGSPLRYPPNGEGKEKNGRKNVHGQINYADEA